MKLEDVLLGLSGFLISLALFAVAAFYEIIPGYVPIYSSLLVIAAITGVVAFRRIDDPQLRGSAGAILAGSVVYWVLGGAELPRWTNGLALIAATVSVGAGCFALVRQRIAVSSTR